MALTATATAAITDMLLEEVLRPNATMISSSVNRRNIFFEAHQLRSLCKPGKLMRSM